MNNFDVKKCTSQLFLYDSAFVRNNKEAIITDLTIAYNRYMAENPTTTNITWDYKKYNIFNLCMFSRPIVHLQNILYKYIFLYFEELEIKHDGFIIQAWLNYHTQKEQLLKVHTHDSPYHGYLSIQPLDSETIFSSWTGEDLHTIKNQVGLLYLNVSNQYTFHRVKMENTDNLNDQPRITLAFDFQPIPFVDSVKKLFHTVPTYDTVFK